jgi:hypothetical protein
MSEGRVASRESLHSRVIGKAMQDEAFRRELLARPRDVVSRELSELTGGMRLTPDIQVTAVEETPTQLYIVLPAPSTTEGSGELSDEDLALAVGGLGEESDPDVDPLLGGGGSPTTLCAKGPGGQSTLNPTC